MNNKITARPGTIVQFFEKKYQTSTDDDIKQALKNMKVGKSDGFY